MNTVPVIPETAPFTLEQRAWLNGYLAGLFSRGSAAGFAGPGQASSTGSATTPPAAALKPLTILFGSQTGTAEGLAKRAAKEAGKRRFAATVRDMGDFSLEQLAQEENLLVITSTYGEGEPPDNAKALHTAVGLAAKDTARGEDAASSGGSTAAAASAPVRLSHLRFSVCALGDTNYVHFCKCGKDFDGCLEKLGGARVMPLAECDLDYDGAFAAWLDSALGALTTTVSSGFNVPGSELQRDAAAVEPEARNPGPGPGYTRQNPFPSPVLVSRRLNAAGSAKQVHHVEFDLRDSGLAYEAGDALGVYAHNCPELVADVLVALGCDGEEAVPAPTGGSIPLRRALTECYDLGRPTPELIALVRIEGLVTGGPSLFVVGRETTVPVQARAPVADPIFHHVIDVLFAPPAAKPAPEDFVRALKKLQPRLYSISSSPRAHAGQVHATVGAVRYEQAGRARKGVCSTFLADRVQPGATRIGVFVHANRAFRLPASGDTPMIMVGPGTGIAPFRAFLHERRATGAQGKNWLLFGDQHAASDFLYREELEELRRSGLLTRLDTAFSRDQAEKIYVQHRMLENAKELYAWLEAGAHFYVCGDAGRMAKDVDATLHRVVELAGAKTPEAAADYVQALRAARRYQRDVY